MKFSYILIGLILIGMLVTPAPYYYIGAYDMATESYGGQTTGTSYTNQAPVVNQNIGTLPTGYTAVLNISGTYEVA